MIKIKWFGTASIIIDINGEKSLFDPFFRWNKKLERPDLRTFCDVDYIFNTHAHFDHTSDLPIILKNSHACLFATPQAIKCLKNVGADISNVKEISPNEKIITKNAKIVIHKSVHIKFDFLLIMRTIFRTLFKFQVLKAIKILKMNHKFKMRNEIVAYEIDAENKKIFIMGSAGYIKNYQYPKNIDVLLFPFQGRSDMVKYSIKIIRKINPSTIILDHFDNSYPPITHDMKTNKFIKAINKNFPHVKIISPKYNEEIVI